MIKKYDRTYFDRWYRGRCRIGPADQVRRKVSLAVSVTEYFLRRTLRNVADIGCGEAPWLDHLREMRPQVRYVGFDPSDYVIQRFGASHNVLRGSFGELGSLGIRERFDLVVCADVLHYLPDDEIRRGFPVLVRWMRGVAFLEVLTREDEMVGDTFGLIRRPAAWYRDLFTASGLFPAGPYMWLGPKLASDAASLERL